MSIETLEDARNALEASGLKVSPGRSCSLMICEGHEPTPGGINLLVHPSRLGSEEHGWTASFPWHGVYCYSISGELPEMVELLVKLYSDRQRLGCSLGDAFRLTVPDHESFLAGGPLSREPVAVAS